MSASEPGIDGARGRSPRDEMTDVTESNGSRGAASDVMDALRARPNNVLLFRGFGPLVVGVVLLVLMLWLAPSVAPEHVVTKPVSTHSATTVAK